MSNLPPPTPSDADRDPDPRDRPPDLPDDFSQDFSGDDLPEPDRADVRRPSWRLWTLPLVLLGGFAVHQLGSLVGIGVATGVLHSYAESLTTRLGVDGEVAIIEQANEAAIGQVFIVSSVLFGQISLGFAAVLAAVVSPWTISTRLGLTRGHWPLWLWGVAALAAPVVGMLWSVVLQQFVDDSDSLKEMSSVFAAIGESGFAIPLAVLVGLMPGVCEELMFRGYLQTRLVGAWGAVAGIAMTSVLFAAFHVDPVHALGVLPLGAYFGWLAWSSKSIFPAMLAHFVNNLIGVLAITLIPRDATGQLPENTEDLPIGVVLAILAVVLASFSCLVITLLATRRIDVDSRVPNS